jgi:hypothetical protein
MVKPDKVWIWTVARRVADAEAVASSWRQILAWPCRTLMTYHDPATHAFVGDGRAALESAVRAVRQIGSPRAQKRTFVPCTCMSDGFRARLPCTCTTPLHVHV